MLFSIMVYLVLRDKSIQTLRIHQFEGITAKMGKNFAVDEAVVGKIKGNLICSRSVVHVVSIELTLIKWSNDTTTEEKVEGVHKDGLVGEITQSGCTISRRVVISVRMLHKVVQRPLLVTRKDTAPSAVMRSREEKRSKGTGLYKRGAWFMRYGITLVRSRGEGGIVARSNQIFN